MTAFGKGGALSFVLVVGLLIVVLSIGITKETPLGSVSGSVRMSESGLPLPGSAIIVTPVTVDDERTTPRITFSDKRGMFQLSSLPAGDYKIEASAKAHELPATQISVREGAVTSLDLELTPKAPELRLYTSQRVFMPDESAQVEAHGFGPDTKLGIKVYKVDLDQFLKKGSIFSALYSLSDNYYADQHQTPEQIGKLVSTFEHPLENADAEGAFTDVVNLNKLPEGFYWVQCTMGNIVRGAYLSVTRIALVTKSSPGQTLCFVTDLKTGQPAAGVDISESGTDKFDSVGKTDANGLATVKFTGKSRKVLMLASEGDSKALSNFYLYQPGDQNQSEGDEGGGDPPSGDVTIFAYTDRPIYRPGDDVQFKGFARKRVGSDYTLPGEGKVTCEVRDQDSTLVQTFDATLQANGSFSGHFQTDADGGPGQYVFDFKTLGADQTLPFTLAAYRKPEFDISVKWSKSHYSLGEKMKATVKCEYYFGGPVAGAKVNANVYRTQDWSYQGSGDESDYEYSNEMEDQGVGGGDFVNQMDGVTDANGEATFEFSPAPDKSAVDYGFTPNYVYTLTAEVTEPGNKFFSGEGTVKVSQGAFNIGVDPDNYIVAPGESVGVTISTLKTEDNSARPNQPVDVTYGIERWSGSQAQFIAYGRTQVTTGPDGRAHIQVRAAQEGNMLVKASSVDEMGNTIKQQGYVYVGTNDFEPPPAASALTLTLDKKLYMPGDTCKALISANKPGLTALVTVEAESVLWSKVVRIDNRSALVDLPVEKGYLPRVTISVVAIQNKKFLETSQPLKIDVNARKLKLSVSADQTQYLPGAKATYTIHAVGPDGKPVPTDLSLAVVDEAVYAIQEDTTDPVKAFYPARQDRVQTNYSFPELYLDGGDKGGDIPVRMNFKDTAAWIPTIRTDSSGVAKVEVQLPDNLTKWRATVIGVSDATDVGLAKNDVTVAKLLMIRLQGPKFMVNGDHQQVAAIVTNNSGRDQDVNVLFQPSGFTTRDRLSQRIRVGNGKSESVSWDVRAAVSGQANLVAKAWVNGGPSDGVQQVITIQPHAREVDNRAAGDIRGTTNFRVAVREDIDPSAGRLKVTFSPTIATSIYTSLDQLIDYPYGCVEQTMSRFLPAMIVSKSLKQVGILRPDLEKKIPAIAKQSFAKLATMQHGDGGWGWWTYDTTDPFMTAYVLDGLKQAEGAGFKVNPNMTDQALAWSEKQIGTAEAKKWASRDHVYLAYALALYGKADKAAAMLKETDLSGVGPATLATAALTENLLGKSFIQARDAHMQQLRGSVIEDTMTAHWKPARDSAYWYEDDDVYGAELSALPILALQTITPDDPLIGKGVRWLLLARHGDWWWSTRDSSFALMAIARYIQNEEPPQTTSTVHMLVNGVEVGHVQLTIQNLEGASPSLTVPLSGLRAGQNQIQLRLENGKQAYYTVDLQQFAVAPILGKLVNGSDFTIERTYHKLESARMEDGTYRLTESKEPVTSVKTGDLIQCDIAITSQHSRNYVMLEDPFPSNCFPAEENFQPDDSTGWDYWYSQREVYDNRITFFARHLGTGTQKFSYVLRAESPGVSFALPPVAGNMYNPQDRTSDAEIRFEVKP